MKLVGFLVVVLLGIVNLQIGEGAGCTGEPNHIDASTMSVEEIVQNEVYIYICQNGYVFTNNDAVAISRCIDGKYTNIPECTTNSLTTCAEPAPTVDGATVSSVSNYEFVKQYTCDGNTTWLSGEAVRFSQCVQQEWTKVHDICDEDCAPPRDCEDINALGLNENGYYRCIPSGIKSGPIRECYCSLTTDGVLNDGNWTYVFSVTDAASMAKTKEQYINGFGDGKTTPLNYFVGLDFLAEYSLNHEASILEVLFIDTATTPTTLEYWASYDDFAVGNKTSYTLERIGNYHGTAGDGLCPQLNTNFILQESTTQMWFLSDKADDSLLKMKGSFIPSKIWFTLNSTALTYQIIGRLSHRAADNQNRCKHIYGLAPEFSYTHTSYMHEYGRNIGSTFSFTCIGKFYKVNNTFTNGTATCKAGENGGPPEWDYIYDVPCKFICPEGFYPSLDKEFCFLSSNETTMGITRASQHCLKYNASLAAVKTPTDLDGAMPDVYYFTSHEGRGLQKDATVIPFDASTTKFSCDSDCTYEYRVKDCLVVMKNSTNHGFYKYVNCETGNFNYLCQLPESCPAGYSPSLGGCFKVLQAPQNPREALKQCGENGSALAFPINESHANALADLVMNKTAQQTVSFYTGYNNGNFTDLKSIYPYHISEVEFNGDAQIIIANINSGILSYSSDSMMDETSASTTAIVCQYHGPVYCGPEPNATEFMVRNIQNVPITYDCELGTFVNSALYNTRQEIQCRKQLGGWIPALLPCQKVEVCSVNDTTVSSALITNSTTEDSFYINGTMALACPANMSWNMELSLLPVAEKNITCIYDPNSNLYRFDPMPPIGACEVCSGEVHPTNASTVYSAAAPPYLVNSSTATVTCDTSYEWDFNATVQTVNCTLNGWDISHLKPCVKVCHLPPPQSGTNCNLMNFTSKALKTELNYTCADGFYLPTSEEFPTVENSIIVTCNDDYNWDNPRGLGPIECMPLCVDEPPAPPSAYSNRTWDNITRIENANVSYTCMEGYRFENYTEEIATICNGSHWSAIDSAGCMKVCNATSLPNSLGTATHNYTEALAFVGATVTYACPSGLLDQPERVSEINVTCTEDGWSDVTDFLCQKLCLDPLPSLPATGGNITRTFSKGIALGSVVNYTCRLGEFSTGLTQFTIECMDSGSWNPSTIPECGRYMVTEVINFLFSINK